MNGRCWCAAGEGQELHALGCSAASSLLKTLKLIKVNMENDTFIDEQKRELYMRVIDQAIEKAEALL